MKNVGIMSMQRVKNYGSFLQAFALKKILEKISQSEIIFVDFKTKNGVKDSAKESLDVLKSNKLKYYILLLFFKMFNRINILIINKLKNYI